MAENSRVLPLRRQNRQNAFDVVDEAHIEHAVGFVQYQHFKLIEAHRVLLVEIEQTARRGDQHIGALAQRHHLRVDLDAAKDHGGTQRQVLAVGRNALAHLCSQLAGRGQDQHTRLIGAGTLPLAQTLQYRQREAGGLAGAGLGAAQQIAAAEDGGDGLALNGRRGGIALGVDGAQQLGAQAKIGKGHAVSAATSRPIHRAGRADRGGTRE